MAEGEPSLHQLPDEVILPNPYVVWESITFAEELLEKALFPFNTVHNCAEGSFCLR